LALRSPISALRSLLLADLRRWDRATSDRVTQFIAISRTVQQRIRECYGRDSVVVYPPVDVEFYTPAPGMRERGFVVHAARVPVAEESQAGRLRRGTKRLAEGGEDFYLCVSALTPYKRLDLAIEACNRLKRRLVVIGCGPEEARLRAMAGPTIEFLGWQSDEAIRDHYRRCHALLFPGVEDFGIVPLEAQACGAPVIAYGAGGATETVIPPTASVPGTGLLFMDQSPESVVDAMQTLERQPELACPTLARSNAVRFRTDRFATEIESSIDSAAGAGPVRTDAGPARAA
jgi:glycosyltransferase involved in cell wall biosynthesis